MKKELTKEEKFAIEKERKLNFIKDEIQFLNEPTYRFNVGDKVRIGSIKESIIDEVLYDGKAYGVKCIITDNNYGNPYDRETYNVFSWVDIRPLNFGDTDFTENEDVKLNYSNSTIESILHKYYGFGVDMNPDYQRDYVWDPSDKEYLLDSIFKGIDIGKFVFVRIPDGEWEKRHFGYEILDGKQRISTLIDFYENRIAYNGKYYNDLSAKDRRTFKNHSVATAELQNYNKKLILKVFLMLNRSGKVMDTDHLNKVEEMLK